MPIDPAPFQGAHALCSELVAEADERNIAIEPEAMALISGAVLCKLLFPQPDVAAEISAALISRRLLADWRTMLANVNRREITLEDVWIWIKGWCPDPVQALRYPNPPRSETA